MDSEGAPLRPDLMQNHRRREPQGFWHPPNPSATTARLTDEHNDQQDAESHQDEAQQAGLPVPSCRPGRGGRRQHNGVRGEVIERVGGCQKP